jgi:prophage regulatory protein
MPLWRTWQPNDGLKKMLRLKQVEEVVGFKSTQIYQQISQGKFPAPVKVSDRASAWIESEILDWLAHRAARRNTAA